MVQLATGVLPGVLRNSVTLVLRSPDELQRAIETLRTYRGIRTTTRVPPANGSQREFVVSVQTERGWHEHVSHIVEVTYASVLLERFDIHTSQSTEEAQEALRDQLFWQDMPERDNGRSAIRIPLGVQLHQGHRSVEGRYVDIPIGVFGTNYDVSSGGFEFFGMGRSSDETYYGPLIRRETRWQGPVSPSDSPVSQVRAASLVAPGPGVVEESTVQGATKRVADSQSRKVRRSSLGFYQNPPSERK